MNPTVFTPHSTADVMSIMAIVIGLIVVIVALVNLARLQSYLNRQHCTDLETLLNELIAERDQLDAQINALSMTLLRTLEQEDSQGKPNQHADAPAIDWPAIDKFPDPAPRSY